MEFDNDKPIFRQIADYCHRCVLSGQWAPEARIPSTKELAVSLAVNTRTVMKAYDELAARGVIYQRRGMGYYVAADASERVREALRADFFADTLPAFVEQMRMAGLTLDDILPHLG